MEVFIDSDVYTQIEHFYSVAMSIHPSLDEKTIAKKVNRLFDAINSLGDYAYIYPLARYKQDWIDKEYREYICEDFHFAYKIYTLLDGSTIVRIHEAVHSLLYHN